MRGFIILLSFSLWAVCHSATTTISTCGTKYTNSNRDYVISTTLTMSATKNCITFDGVSNINIIGNNNTIVCPHSVGYSCNSRYGISFLGVSGKITMNNVRFNQAIVSISATAGGNYSFNGNYFMNYTTFQGSTVVVTFDGTAKNLDYLYIQNNTFASCYRALSMGGYVNRAIITDNLFRNTLGGILSGSISEYIIERNTAIDNAITQDTLFTISCYAARVRDNVIRGASGISIVMGISFATKGLSMTERLIANNTIENIETKNYAKGITIDANSNNNASVPITVEQNTLGNFTVGGLASNTLSGIEISNCLYITLRRNTIRDFIPRPTPVDSSQGLNVAGVYVSLSNVLFINNTISNLRFSNGSYTSNWQTALPQYPGRGTESPYQVIAGIVLNRGMLVVQDSYISDLIAPSRTPCPSDPCPNGNGYTVAGIVVFNYYGYNFGNTSFSVTNTKFANFVGGDGADGFTSSPGGDAIAILTTGNVTVSVENCSMEGFRAGQAGITYYPNDTNCNGGRSMTYWHPGNVTENYYSLVNFEVTNSTNATKCELPPVSVTECRSFGGNNIRYSLANNISFSGKDCLIFSNAQKITIEGNGFSIICTGDSYSCGSNYFALKVQTTEDVTVQNLAIVGSRAYFTSTGISDIFNCSFHLKEAGIYLGAVIPGTASELRIHNSRFYNSDFAVKMTYDRNIFKTSIFDNYIYGAGVGLQLDCLICNVNNNVFENSGGIIAECANGTFTGNHFFGGTLGTAMQVSWYLQGTTGWTGRIVSDNTITNVRASSASFRGIVVQCVSYQNTVEISNNVVSNVEINGAYEVTSFELYMCENFIMENNAVANIFPANSSVHITSSYASNTVAYSFENSIGGLFIGNSAENISGVPANVLPSIFSGEYETNVLGLFILTSKNMTIKDCRFSNFTGANYPQCDRSQCTDTSGTSVAGILISSRNSNSWDPIFYISITNTTFSNFTGGNGNTQAGTSGSDGINDVDQSLGGSAWGITTYGEKNSVDVNGCKLENFEAGTGGTFSEANAITCSGGSAIAFGPYVTAASSSVENFKNGTTCAYVFCTSQCLNGGNCTAPETCSCEGTGYNGSTCNIPICASQCLNGGNCSAPWTCECEGTGYNGSTCNLPICTSCLNGGNCSAPGTCDCEGTGYNGATCNSPICSSPCLHGGNCSAPGTCDCEGTGYNGSTCNSPICTSQCLNGGNCSAPDTCTCAGTGYNGSTCNSPICMSQCLHDGNCTAPDTCTCAGTGYNGTTCNSPICTSQCLNGGNCSAPETCACEGTGYNGSTCNSPICTSYCLNGGNCTAPNICDCHGTGYNGSSCNEAICTSPCLNGGNCTAPNTCKCEGTGFNGSNCNSPICTSQCLNGGNCTAPETCNCEGTGYNGSTCNSPISSTTDTVTTSATTDSTTTDSTTTDTTTTIAATTDSVTTSISITTDVATTSSTTDSGTTVATIDTSTTAATTGANTVATATAATTESSTTTDASTIDLTTVATTAEISTTSATSHTATTVSAALAATTSATTDTSTIAATTSDAASDTTTTAAIVVATTDTITTTAATTTAATATTTADTTASTTAATTAATTDIATSASTTDIATSAATTDTTTSAATSDIATTADIAAATTTVATVATTATTAAATSTAASTAAAIATNTATTIATIATNAATTATTAATTAAATTATVATIATNAATTAATIATTAATTAATATTTAATTAATTATAASTAASTAATTASTIATDTTASAIIAATTAATTASATTATIATTAATIATTAATITTTVTTGTIATTASATTATTAITAATTATTAVATTATIATTAATTGATAATIATTSTTASATIAATTATYAASTSAASSFVGTTGLSTTSDCSATSSCPPGPPLPPLYKWYNRSAIIVAWSAPDNVGEEPITEYTLEFSSDQAVWVTLITELSLEYLIGGLETDASYYFKVAASNMYGIGPFSIMSILSTAPIYCGDGVCDINENCSSCVFDCLSCGYKPCEDNCNGHGSCREDGFCTCNNGWDGPSCGFPESTHIEFKQNSTSPQFALYLGDSTLHEASGNVIFDISFQNIQEVTSSGEIVGVFSLTSQEYLVEVSNDSLALMSNFTTTLSNGAQITIFISFYLNDVALPFANRTLLMSANSVRYTMRVSNWDFDDISNQLLVTMTSHNDVITECSQVTKQNDKSENLQWAQTSVNGVTLYTRVTDAAILDSEVRTIKSTFDENVISFQIPHFWDAAEFDPDFKVLIPEDEAQLGCESAVHHNGDGDNISKTGAIAGSVVGVSVAAMAAGAIAAYIKRQNKNKQKQKMSQASAFNHDNL